MQWNDAFNLGIEEIDEQHRAIADHMAVLDEAVTAKKRWSDVHAALVRLTDQVRIHFEVEESVMRIHRYPEIERHGREHEEFNEQLTRLREHSLRSGVTVEMIALAQKWLREHITTSDKHYADYLPTVRISSELA